MKLKKINPGVRVILRTAIYQLLFLSRIPPRAAVNEAVELAKHTQPDYIVRYVNALLRKVSQNRELLKDFTLPDHTSKSISITYSHPVWLVEAWLREIGFEETIKLCKANNQVPPLSVRTNTLITDTKTLTQRFQELDLIARACSYAPNALQIEKGHYHLAQSTEFHKGFFQIQDEASQLATHLLTPSPGERILDGCAGFGGKTSLIAQLMENKGQIVAVDHSEWKITALKDNLKRLGITIVEPFLSDIRNLQDKNLSAFDRILIDAPCSGLGGLRRKPDIKWKRRPGDVYRLSQLQREILESVAGFLKPGGILVYVTCTLLRIENESVVESFLQNHADFCIEAVKEFLPKGCESFARDEYFYSWPHLHNTDGFFASRLKRIA